MVTWPDLKFFIQKQTRTFTDLFKKSVEFKSRPYYITVFPLETFQTDQCTWFRACKFPPLMMVFISWALLPWLIFSMTFSRWCDDKLVILSNTICRALFCTAVLFSVGLDDIAYKRDHENSHAGTGNPRKKGLRARCARKKNEVKVCDGCAATLKGHSNSDASIDVQRTDCRQFLMLDSCLFWNALHIPNERRGI